MKDIKNKIKKKYSYIRESYVQSEEKPYRLVIEKAKWYNNADSPVMLMIDDLTNAWYSRNGGSCWDFGGDWGGGLGKNGSAISFLKERLLTDYPEVKVTFFAIAGKIKLGIYNKHFTFSKPLNFNEETKRFFRELNDNDKFEIAYHGYNHGTQGNKTKPFIQEWKGFKTVEQACEQILKGKEIFKEVFGKYPSGGKYGGWKYNELADESIDRSNFLWWCRDWMPRDIRDRIGDSYYEPQFFGKNLVVALPSTIHGFFWHKKQIDKLLMEKQIISIEEHIAPLRPDGRIQKPNIIDDITELRTLFSYLKSKNVWYATCTEIARYFIGYSQSTIYDIKYNSFKIRYTGRINRPILTLIIDCSSICNGEKPKIEITLPNGDNLEYQQIDRYYKKNNNHIIIDIPVYNGKYLLKEK